MDNSHIKRYNYIAEYFSVEVIAVYEIKLLSVPKILFCGSVAINDYENEFRNPRDFIELSVIEEGRILVKGERERVVKPRSLFAITSAVDCSTAAVDGEKQRHTTVGVNVRYEIREVDSREICEIDFPRGDGVLLLPERDELDDKTYANLLAKIKRIAAKYHSSKGASGLSAIAAWYDLCAEITLLALLEAGKGEASPSSVLYARKAEAYISKHIFEKITATDVASSLGLSVGYLHCVFKKVVGKSVTQYVNERKIAVAVEMLEYKKLKLKDVADSLGVDDYAYMSRLFKKVVGVSFNEFKRDASVAKYDRL